MGLDRYILLLLLPLLLPLLQACLGKYRPSLEERLESIISRAALMADSSCTRWVVVVVVVVVESVVVVVVVVVVMAVMAVAVVVTPPASGTSGWRGSRPSVMQ